MMKLVFFQECERFAFNYGRYGVLVMLMNTHHHLSHDFST